MYTAVPLYVSGLRLLKATDQLHDDTYMLSQLCQSQLLDMLFPIGDMTGEVVHAIVKSSPLSELTKLPLVCLVSLNNRLRLDIVQFILW